MKILVSDVEQGHANTCKSKIEEECPTATVTTRLESLSASVTWALANRVDIISRSTTGLCDARNESEGDTAWAGSQIDGEFSDEFSREFDVSGLWKVGIVHALGSNSHILDTDPSGLDIISAVSGGSGGACVASYGAGLEYFCNEETTQSYSTARIAGKIGQLMVDHPDWNFHDARQALRQTASFYATGWVADGGFGAVDKDAATSVETLELSSPTRQSLSVSIIDRQMSLSWKNQKQSDFSSTVIAKFESDPLRTDTPEISEIIYDGTDESYTYGYTDFGDFYIALMTKDGEGNYSLIESFDKSEQSLLSYSNYRLMDGAMYSPLLRSSML